MYVLFVVKGFNFFKQNAIFSTQTNKIANNDL